MAGSIFLCLKIFPSTSYVSRLPYRMPSELLFFVSKSVLKAVSHRHDVFSQSLWDSPTQSECVARGKKCLSPQSQSPFSPSLQSFSSRLAGLSLRAGGLEFPLATMSVAPTGCKENHFYSLPFGQAEASIY